MTSLDLEDLGSVWPVIPPVHPSALWYCGWAAVLLLLTLYWWRLRR